MRMKMKDLQGNFSLISSHPTNMVPVPHISFCLVVGSKCSLLSWLPQQLSFHLLVHCCVTDDDYYEDDEEDDPDALKDPIYQVDLQVRYRVTVSPM